MTRHTADAASVAAAIDAQTPLIADEMKRIVASLARDESRGTPNTLELYIERSCAGALDAMDTGDVERAKADLARLAASAWVMLASLRLAADQRTGAIA